MSFLDMFYVVLARGCCYIHLEWSGSCAWVAVVVSLRTGRVSEVYPEVDPKYTRSTPQ